jgi:hypothetical protein
MKPFFLMGRVIPACPHYMHNMPTNKTLFVYLFPFLCAFHFCPPILAKLPGLSHFCPDPYRPNSLQPAPALA